jgi:hypothetical protein
MKRPDRDRNSRPDLQHKYLEQEILMSQTKSNTPRFVILDQWPGYRFSAVGQVESCWRPNGNSGWVQGDTWRPLKPSVKDSGHLSVILCRDGKRHNRYVHRLVLEAFIGPRPEGQETRHLNGRPGDNQIDNLVWGTRTENRADRVRHGTANQGEQHPRAKLTEAQVLKIREQHAGGIRQATLSRLFGVSRFTIGNIVRRESWQHI